MKSPLKNQLKRKKANKHLLGALAALAHPWASRHKAFLAKKPLLLSQFRVVVNQELGLRSFTKVPVVAVDVVRTDVRA